MLLDKEEAKRIVLGESGINEGQSKCLVLHISVMVKFYFRIVQTRLLF